MAELTWSGKDAFDATGRRVGAVLWCFDFGHGAAAVQGAENSGPGFFTPRWYWEAFVAVGGHFDHVLVDGRSGHWKKKADAQAAVESAYRALVTEVPRDADTVPVDAVAEPIDDRGPQPTGVVGNIRSIVRAWRAAR